MKSTEFLGGACATSNTHANRQLRNKAYPWLVVLFSSLFLFYKYVLQVSPSVMTNDLMRHFHVNAAGLGNLAATFFYSYLVVQLFVGPLLDKFSPRTLTALALAGCALGALWFSEAQTLLSATLARSLVGASAAFATVSYMKMGTIWFKSDKLAFVSGLLATAAMLGSMAGQVPLGYLMTHVGWQTALLYCSVPGLALAGLYYLCVKDKPVPDKTLTLASPTSKDFLTLLKQKHNWLLLFYSGLAFSPLAVFGGLWGNPFLQEAFRVSRSQAGLLVSCSFVGLAVGGPLLGWLADRFNKRYAAMWFGLVFSLVNLTMAVYMPGLNYVLEGLLLFLFGFGTGAFMLGFVMGKALNSVALAASVVALVNTGDAVFGAFSEPLAGKILDLTWSGKTVNGAHYFSVHDYHLALMMLPVYLGLAGLFLFGLKKNKDFI